MILKTLEQHPDIFRRAEVTKKIIASRQFWTDVEVLRSVLISAKRAVKGVKYKTATLGSVYIE